MSYMDVKTAADRWELTETDALRVRKRKQAYGLFLTMPKNQ